MVVDTLSNIYFFHLGRQCNKLEPPVYGKVSLPCLPYFDSICQVECVDAYYLVGSNTDTCSVSEDGAMRWRKDYECRGNFF